MQMSSNGATQAKVLRLDAKDNVLVALTDLRKGETLNYSGNEYTLLSDVPAKHKFLTQDVGAGGEITMYGVLVGTTVEGLRRGDLLSTRNIRHAAASFQESEVAGPRWSAPNVSTWAKKTLPKQAPSQELQTGKRACQRHHFRPQPRLRAAARDERACTGWRPGFRRRHPTVMRPPRW